MTIPLLLFDIVSLTYLLAKYFVQMMALNITKLIYDSIRTVFGSVFFIIQYNAYEEATKTVYEVVGTIALIPYSLGE